MKKKYAFILAVTAVLVSATFGAAGQDLEATKEFHGITNYRITITNATVGQPLTPPVVVAHNSRMRLFRVGEPASDALRLVAEDGDVSGFMEMLAMSPNVGDYAIGDGPFLPGQSVVVEVEAKGAFNRISVVGMLATTNDAFYGVTGAGPVYPYAFGAQKLAVPAYDAGTEHNSEDCDYIPGPPCGNPGVRDTDGAEGFVTVHSGVHGVGDLPPWTSDWRNPVAIVTIELVAN